MNCQIVHEQEQKRALERAIAHEQKEQKEQEQTPKIDLRQRKFPLPQTGHLTNGKSPRRHPVMTSSKNVVACPWTGFHVTSKGTMAAEGMPVAAG